MDRKTVAFVCTGNSCRSQMAEGFAKAWGGDVMDVYSAGTHPADKIDPLAVEVMKEAGIDIKGQCPKLLNDIPGSFDVLVTMGCEVECPFVPARKQENWGIPDPVGKPIGEFRAARDTIADKVKELIAWISTN
jgi:arsenate reductase